MSKKLKVAIIGEKLGADNAQSSTMLADEAIGRGYKVYEIAKENVAFLKGRITAKGSIYKSREMKEIFLDDMDVILFRPNPPVDIEYITLLNLLRLIEDKVLIINRPTSILNFPEKIFPHYFHDISPPTLICNDKNRIKDFLKRHKRIILKPLYEYGGKGVILIEKEKDIGDIKHSVVAQKFIPQVQTTGDKRIFILFGKAVAADIRKPAPGSIVANVASGGSYHACKITEMERKLSLEIGKKLMQEEIFICGIDIIGGFVTEINITSPAGFYEANKLYNLNLAEIFWRQIEKKLNGNSKKS